MQPKDRFLELGQELEYGVDEIFVFDSLSITCNEPDNLDGNIASSPSSPFKDKPPDDCATILRQLRQDAGSNIDYETFRHPG